MNKKYFKFTCLASKTGGGVGRMFSRGGQLQVAGVVVGSWGPNYGSSGNDYRPRGTRYPVRQHILSSYLVT